MEATEQAEVSEEQFRDRCASVVRLDLSDSRNPFYGERAFEGKLVEIWFEKLELPLLPREAGCLDFFCA